MITPTLWAPRRLVNTTESGPGLHDATRQGFGQIAPLNDGGYIIVWEDESHTYNPSGTAIVGQRFNSLGDKVGGEVKLSDFNTGSQTDAAITRLSDGNVAVAFRDFLSGAGSDIYVNVYGPALNFIRRDLIETTSSVHGGAPALTALANGAYVVSYTNIATSDETIDIALARIVSGTGAAGGTFELYHDLDNKFNPQLATLSNGNFVSVMDYSPRNGGSNDLIFSIFTATGAPVAGAFYVAGAFDPSLDEELPNVAALTGGGFVVVWVDNADSKSLGTIRASIYNNAGGVGPRTAFAVSSAPTNADTRPDVVGLADGGFIVTWKNSDALAQRFDAAGNAVGDIFTVEPNPPIFANGKVDVALLTSGRFAFASDYEQALNDTDVSTSIWDPHTSVANDFNGDRRADILFSKAGAVLSSNYEWQLNDRTISGQGALDVYDKSFTVQVIGDFDADGKSDLLFENPSTGGVWEWRLNGTAIVSQGAVDVGDKTYHLLGAADLDGNGTDDLIWRNDFGFIYEWWMKPQAGIAGSDVPLPVQQLDPHWHIVGAGDFDGDTKADLLLRNIGGAASDNGAFYLWMMNGPNIKAQGGIERPSTSWVTLGTGDFDGDGKTDFAVRHVSNFAPGELPGAVWVYLMDGATIKAQGAAGVANAAQFHVAGIADYNGDGKDDILFRNDAGYFYSWDMDGTHIQSEGAIPWADPTQKVVTQHWDLV